MPKSKVFLTSALTILSFIIAASAQEPGKFSPKPIDRLFLTPSGEVLPSMNVNFALGGSYGTMNKGEYLGIAAVGLGNVAELEISTWRLVSNLFNGTTALGTTTLKIALMKESKGLPRPGATLTFRSTPSWALVEYDMNELTSEVRETVRSLKFETHLASLFLTVSKKLWDDLSLNAGISLTDSRTRSGIADLVNQPSLPQVIPDLQENLIGGFIGFQRQVNPRTILMFEVSSVPRFTYRSFDNRLELDQVALLIGGFRFYFNQWMSTDAGVKYRTDYIGIADAEISVGMNLGFNIQELLKR